MFSYEELTDKIANCNLIPLFFRFVRNKCIIKQNDKENITTSIPVAVEERNINGSVSSTAMLLLLMLSAPLLISMWAVAGFRFSRSDSAIAVVEGISPCCEIFSPGLAELSCSLSPVTSVVILNCPFFVRRNRSLKWNHKCRKLLLVILFYLFPNSL
mgnify:CR=1 FL=1